MRIYLCLHWQVYFTCPATNATYVGLQSHLTQKAEELVHHFIIVL